MAGAEQSADVSKSAPTLPAVLATTAPAQVKKAQNSIGACDACRLRKVSETDASLAAYDANTITGALPSK